MRMIRRILHLPTLSALLAVYLLAVGVIFCVPHRVDGFGRMNAYQQFAQVGRVLSFGLLDRRLVDWYMLGPTLEANTEPYNRIIAGFILQQTPVFIAWFLLIAIVVNQIRAVDV